MLVLNVIYKCKPGKREDFLKTIKAEGIDQASRDEEGNFRYDYFLSADDPDEILLLECWKDEDAQKYHSTLPHFKRLGEFKSDYVESTEISKYFEQ